jgi:hypothetical protein
VPCQLCLPCTGVLTVLTGFKLSSRFGFLRHSGSGGAAAPTPTPATTSIAQVARRASLEDIAQALHHSLTGCQMHSMKASALVRRIDTAVTPQALWLLRPEVYELIAQSFSQSEAQRRVNELLPVFEGWIAAKQLNAV